MFYEEGHPIVTLKDWQAFKSWQASCKIFPSHRIDEVIDRNECGCLPDWLVPFACGVVIASDALLREAGYHPGKHRPRDWRKVSLDCYRQLIGNKGLSWPDALVIRRCDKHEWWAIERRVADVNEILVFNFGSTPIFTRSCQSATHLATHCNVNNPLPLGLRWIKQAPDDCPSAIEIARKRNLHEVLSAVEARLPV